MRRALVGAVLAATSLALHAVELRVLSAGAVEPGMRPAVAEFERASGHTVMLAFAAAPALRAALHGAAVADVVVVPRAIADELAARVPDVAGELASVGKVGVGVAVRSGADLPDITTAATLRTALGNADAVIYNRASTGAYVERMLAQLGVDDAVRARSERVSDGAAVLARLRAGTALREIGFAAITEIVLDGGRGIRLVGPLPPALQNETEYVALPWPGPASTDPARADAVAALMRHLRGSAAQALFVKAGIAPSP